MFRVGKEEAEAVSRVILSGSYFKTRNVYNETEQAENEMKELFGVKNALTMTSGMAALVSGLTALGIGPGNQVIVPAYIHSNRNGCCGGRRRGYCGVAYGIRTNRACTVRNNCAYMPFLYSDGVTPVFALNAVLKCGILVYPTCSAMSPMLASVSVRSRFAASIRSFTR